MTGHTRAKLSDEAVSLLPLQAGRAELLEEIVSTPVLTPYAPEAVGTRSRRTRWLVPVAAAAAVAGIATASLWGQGLLPDGSPWAGQSTQASGHRYELAAAGWEVSSTESGDKGYGEVTYAKGGATFKITWYPARSYESYVADREHIVDPPAPGEPVSVLGRPGQLWALNAQDHTVIREVEDGFWTEFRGEGMDEAGFRRLLARLRPGGP